VCILVYSNGADTALWRLLGINGAAAPSLARTATITIPAHVPVFGPTAAAIAAGGRVTFVNQLDSAITIRSTAEAPAQFTVVAGAHARATITLPRPGLYHYYDATDDQIAPPTIQAPASPAPARSSGYSSYSSYSSYSDSYGATADQSAAPTATPATIEDDSSSTSGYADSDGTSSYSGAYGAADEQSAPTAAPATTEEAGMTMPAVSADDMIVPKRGTGLPREGWIEVLSGMPSLQQYVMIPQGRPSSPPKSWSRWPAARSW
jgi:plastocyanin